MSTLSYLLSLIVIFFGSHWAQAHAPSTMKLEKSDFHKIIEDLENLKNVNLCGKKPILFDAHLHYHDPMEKVFKPEQIIEILKAAGVRKALLSSRPMENSQRLYDLDPDRFYLGMMPYKVSDDFLYWTSKPDRVELLVNYLKEQKYPYRAMGEFHVLREDHFEREPVKRLVSLAQEYDLMLHAHTSAAGVEKLFTMYPGADVLWAHAGQGTYSRDPNAREISSFMDKYPKLWVEISFNQYVMKDGVVQPEWKALFSKHHERILVGTDPFDVDRWQDFSKVILELQNILCQLPSNVANSLAWGTSERLFGKSR